MLPFTDLFREVLDLAVREAHRMRHPSVAPEHYLLAMIRHGSDVGTVAMRILLVDTARLKKDLERTIGYGTGKTPTDILPNASAQRVLDEACEIAKAMEHATVSTGNLLLAIMREDDSPAALCLARVGLGYEEVCEQVILIIEGSHAVGMTNSEEDEDPELDAEEGLMEMEGILQAAGEDLSMDWIDLEGVDFTRDLLGLFSVEVLDKYRFIPVQQTEKEVCIAIADPGNLEEIAKLCRGLGKHVKYMICGAGDFQETLDRLFGLGEEGGAAV